MVDTVLESEFFPVNSNGEIILQQGVGDNTVAGYVHSSKIPADYQSGKMVVKLPRETALVNKDASNNFTGITSVDVGVFAKPPIQTRPLFKFSALHGLTNARQASGTGDTMTLDTSVLRTGSATVKLTLPTNGTYWGELVLPTLAHKFNRLRAGILCYIPDFTKIGNITLYASKDAGYANFVTMKYAVMDTGGNANRFNGWHYVTLPNSVNGVAVGAGTVSAGDTITTAKVRVSPAGGTNGGTVYFDSFYQDATTAKPSIMIVADDNYSSWNQYAIPYLNSLGLKSTLAVIGSTVGSANYMTLAELQTAYVAGHDLVTHGLSALNTYGTAKARLEDVLANQAFLSNNGFTRRNGHLHYIYPNGVYEMSSGDQEIVQIMHQAGMLSARGVTKPTRIDHSVDIGDRLLSYHILGGENTDTPAILKALIDDCITYGESGSLMFHKIVTGTTGANIEYNKADFEDVISYIATKKAAGLIDVLTVPEWYASVVKPPLVSSQFLA